MADMRVIGKPALRTIDGTEKVTGTAHYTADVALPGTFWGKTLKSPYAHAASSASTRPRRRRCPASTP